MRTRLIIIVVHFVHDVQRNLVHDQTVENKSVEKLIQMEILPVEAVLRYLLSEFIHVNRLQNNILRPVNHHNQPKLCVDECAHSVVLHLRMLVAIPLLQILVGWHRPVTSARHLAEGLAANQTAHNTFLFCLYDKKNVKIFTVLSHIYDSVNFLALKIPPIL